MVSWCSGTLSRFISMLSLILSKFFQSWHCYSQRYFHSCHWYFRSCELFTLYQPDHLPTKVLGIERKVIGQHHASAVLYEHRFIQNQQQFQYWPRLLIIITLKMFKRLVVRIIFNSVRQFRTYTLTPTNWLLMITTESSSSGHHFIIMWGLSWNSWLGRYQNMAPPLYLSQWFGLSISSKSKIVIEVVF